MIRDSRIQCYIKKIGIHHYRASTAKIVISFQGSGMLLDSGIMDNSDLG